MVVKNGVNDLFVLVAIVYLLWVLGGATTAHARASSQATPGAPHKERSTLTP
jgi:hypothetical protein